MLIDWFTVAAQAINFLILVYLLKRFLYQPILDAIDAREHNIAAQLADAASTCAMAQKEQTQFAQKNAEFELQRNALMQAAQEAVQVEEKRLMQDAQAKAESWRLAHQQNVAKDVRDLKQALNQKVTDEVFTIVRKTLGDLAGTSVEVHVTALFIQRLVTIPEQERAVLIKALSSKEPAEAVLIRSAFALSKEQGSDIKQALEQVLSTPIEVQFESKASLLSGIEIQISGQKLAWNIDDYLATLEKSIDDILQGYHALSN